MFEVIKINLRGTDHYFHFNNYALVELGKLTQTDTLEAATALNDIIEKNLLLGMTMIIYCGFVGYQYSKFNLNHGYTIEDISGIVATAKLDEFDAIWEAYKKATGMSEFLEKQAAKAQAETADGESKKKSHSGKSLNLQSAK